MGNSSARCCVLLAAHVNCNGLGGGFCAAQKPVLEVFPARERTGRWEVVEWGRIMAIEKIKRGRTAKIDNEK